MTDTVVVPNADGTGATNYTITGGPASRFGAINNGIATPDDTDYIRNFFSEGGGPEIAFFGFEDMPESFNAATGCSVKIRQRAASNGDDGAKYQIFKSDGTTPLTDQISLTANGTAISTSFRDDTLGFTITGDTDNVSWNGAQIKITHDGPGDGDDPQLDISEIEMTVTHTSTSGGGSKNSTRLSLGLGI